MKNQVWQDETVQALKQGYQEVIDKQTGEITALRERVEAQRLVLKIAEWGRFTPLGRWSCPVCKELENHGHAENCELAAVLKSENQ